MSFKRYVAIKDNSITNAYSSDGSTRATGSNTGEADVLEVFANYGDVQTSEMERSRILIEFDVDQIISDKAAGIIPSSGITWYLKMFNVEHGLTVPKNFNIDVHRVTNPWEEGYGVDLDNHGDKAKNFGSTWANRNPSNTWDDEGGDFSVGFNTQTFTTGLEDLEIDITSTVEEHISGSSPNYGFILKFPDDKETGEVSYYTKRFFARSSEFFYKRPVLEARWDASIKDDRGSFYASSSIQSASDNLNNIYLYNHVRGILTDYPIAPTSASFRTTASDAGTEIVKFEVTKPANTTGTYKVEAHVDTTASTIFDVWFNGSTAYHTGTIEVKNFSDDKQIDKYILKISNAQNYYNNVGTQRFRLYARPKNWSPNIYTVAKDTPETTIIPSASIEITRVIDGEMIVPHGTGSTQHTIMSYDVYGNYFDLDMTMFEPGYDYAMTFAFYNDDVKTWQDQGYKFRFKVRKDE
tara:strand:- start:261 stop:1658 length:1398 start_codon:yes stop_codon:yes gene_type:complete